MPLTPQAVDDAAIGFMARNDHGPLRPLLDTADRAAVLFLPWAAVSGRLLRSGRPGAGAAVWRGWSAVALSSLVDDGLIKPLMQRGRPDAERLPPERSRHREPSTSSFPSGHVGAAAAFAAATWDGAPELRGPLVAIAALTAYAHAYTGRHYVTDVIVGAGIGMAAGRLVARWSEDQSAREATG